jgi:hypothetical protein
MKEIKLPNRSVLVLVSDEDADLADHHWHASDNGYAIRTLHRDGARTERLHRVVMSRMLGRELKAGELVDHISGEVTDNRRSNLRLADHQSNAWNRSGPNSTGYKGVRLLSGRRKFPFAARITYDKQRFTIGVYATAAEAAWMYDQWASELFGAFARTNFAYREATGFDLETYVQTSTAASGVPERVSDPKTLAAAAVILAPHLPK